MQKISLSKIKIDPLTDFWKGEKKLAMCEANYTHDVGDPNNSDFRSTTIEKAKSNLPVDPVMVELFQELTFHMIRMLELEPKLDEYMQMYQFTSTYDLQESKEDYTEAVLFILNKYVCNGIVLAADGEMVMLLGNKGLRGKKQLNLTTPLFHADPPEGMDTYDRIDDLMGIVYAIQDEFSAYILENKHGGSFYEQKTIFDEMDENKEFGVPTHIELSFKGKSVKMTTGEFDKAAESLMKN